MKKTLIAATPFLALGLIAIACSFPEPTFGTNVTDGGDSGTSSDSSFLVPDATRRSDATALVTKDNCVSDAACDCDGDGFLSDKCDAGGKAGDDCDDFDPLRKPDAGFVNEETSNGDWNCDGTVTYDPPLVPRGNEGCNGNTGSCRQDAVFVDPPKCGTNGTLFQCSGAITGQLTGCKQSPGNPPSFPAACK